jgi:hypothetical protein
MAITLSIEVNVILLPGYKVELISDLQHATVGDSKRKSYASGTDKITKNETS